MRVDSTFRVMWLLNHTTLRAFEIPQLSKAGVAEIYTPKKFPWDEGNLSASITYDYDEELTIPSSDLKVLNSQDWYGEPNKEAWDIVNKYFDILFIGFFPNQIKSASRHFLGSVVLRAFGLGGEETYSKLIQKLDNSKLYSAINQIKNRFWFGMGYQHLADSEEELVSSRSVYMPVGLKSIKISDEWIGSSKQILFICSRIGSSPYFFNVYKKFINNFKDFPFCIGGAQPIDIDDPNVLGFLSNESYAKLMQNSRVMFYHSNETNHVHYHPFEAVRAGIPLIFMANGMLDRLGGKCLPGRANSIEEAKNKIRRVLNDDIGFINDIKNTQNILLACMDPQVCEVPWRENFERIVSSLKNSKTNLLSGGGLESKYRIAVVVPVGGGARFEGLSYWLKHLSMVQTKAECL